MADYVDPLVSGGNNGNHTALQMPVWVATNPYAAQIGAEVVKQDMESVRAGLLYGLGKTKIHAFLTGRHGRSEHARFYAHGLVDSIRLQIKSELAVPAQRGTQRGR
jgi:hypothetical protein